MQPAKFTHDKLKSQEFKEKRIEKIERKNHLYEQHFVRKSRNSKKNN